MLRHFSLLVTELRIVAPYSETRPFVRIPRNHREIFAYCSMKKMTNSEKSFGEMSAFVLMMR